MKALVLVLSALAACASAAAGGWSSSVPFTNTVASTPVNGGGYPVPAGSDAPVPGTCRLGDYNSNRSESWIALQPGTENLVGAAVGLHPLPVEGEGGRGRPVYYQQQVLAKVPRARFGAGF